MDERMLTPEQVAEKLQITAGTVYVWLRSGRIRGVKLGRLWRIRPADLSAFLDHQARQEQSHRDDAHDLRRWESERP